MDIDSPSSKSAIGGAGEGVMTEANVVARLPEVEQVSGLSRSSIYRLEASGEFPKRVKLGQRAVGWPREALLNWCRSRPGVERAA